MNILELPWSPIVLIIATLFILFLREASIVIRAPRFHPERKMAVFNGIILILLIILTTYGTNLLILHDHQFTSVFPQYPNSRYAPEREFLSKGVGWAYITPDLPEKVITFYRDGAFQGGYNTTWSESTTSNRLMMKKENEILFLTALKDKDITVLYFSPEGEVVTYQEPSN